MPIDQSILPIKQCGETSQPISSCGVMRNKSGNYPLLPPPPQPPPPPPPPPPHTHTHTLARPESRAYSQSGVILIYLFLGHFFFGSRVSPRHLRNTKLSGTCQDLLCSQYCMVPGCSPIRQTACIYCLVIV